MLEVGFQLGGIPRSAPFGFAELARALRRRRRRRAPLTERRRAVLRLRRGKAMVLDPADPDSRSAGSFFTSRSWSRPWCLAGVGGSLRGTGSRGPLPRRPGQGPRRVADRAGRLTGPPRRRRGRGSAQAHPGPGQPRWRDRGHPVTLARAYRDRVRDAFGVELAIEPTLIGLKL